MLTIISFQYQQNNTLMDEYENGTAYESLIVFDKQIISSPCFLKFCVLIKSQISMTHLVMTKIQKFREHVCLTMESHLKKIVMWIETQL